MVLSPNWPVSVDADQLMTQPCWLCWLGLFYRARRAPSGGFLLLMI